jgi:hypothetical protein
VAPKPGMSWGPIPSSLQSTAWPPPGGRFGGRLGPACLRCGCGLRRLPEGSRHPPTPARTARCSSTTWSSTFARCLEKPSGWSSNMTTPTLRRSVSIVARAGLLDHDPAHHRRPFRTARLCRHGAPGAHPGLLSARMSLACLRQGNDQHDAPSEVGPGQGSLRPSHSCHPRYDRCRFDPLERRTAKGCPLRTLLGMKTI